ncbi:MAG: glycoside hydrolase family 3 C-terminal domain-containing protein [Lachnospiraceae bacterium]|nr:glycoside hydrolase family 3 C-terminal domain-containing protein [Lachnospiraceae bacterium]
MTEAKIKELVAQMTLEEKAALTSGEGPWMTKAVERLGIASMWMSDGPHGLRKQENYQEVKDINDSLPAVSLPAECAMAASFDRDLLYRIGTELGREAQFRNVHLILGPGVNMKRSPLCGRNFEYLSEDPCLAGVLGGAYIKGIQSQGVGACVKHYLANSQETRRFTSSSEVDERTLREIYMKAFESIVKDAKPMAVMSSYNRINGTYATANKYFMKDVLRDEWGYEGCVISDWGATHDRTAAVAAGTALTMPGVNETDHEVSNAVKAGILEEKDLDTACEQILKMVFDGLEAHREGVTPDYDAERTVMREAVEQSAVLLKNKDRILPLQEGSKVAFIGGFAKEPRYQGGGSSHVTPIRLSNAFEACEQLATITYAEGYPEAAKPRLLVGIDLAGDEAQKEAERRSLEPDEKLIAEAVEVAKASDVAVIFAGLPELMESEGEDRKGLDLPPSHNALIEAVAAAQPNTVVVLSNGSPVTMPWIRNVKAVLEMYLGGETVGEATANLLFGRANPCGRLPETFPMKIEDTPCFLFFPGEGDSVPYQEGIYIGYRYYATKKMPVLFPFGYGLSYTTFVYTDLRTDTKELEEKGTVRVSVHVKNIGKVPGREVVQLYVAPKGGEIKRPVRELRAFDKVYLEPGQEETVSFTLSPSDFAYWDTGIHGFRVAEGEYSVLIGRNAFEMVLGEDISCQKEINLL